MWPILMITAAVVSAPPLPRLARQGQTLRISATPAAHSARMAGRTIRLFPQKDGATLGLMPVSAIQKPGTYKLELLDSQGSSIKSSTVRVRNSGFGSQNIRIAKALSELKPLPGEKIIMEAFLTTVSDKRMWQEPLRLPLPGCMTSPYGVRRLHNRKPTGAYHAGLDQKGSAGDPIFSVTAGTVRLARDLNVSGGTVGVDHGQGLLSLYMHMSKIAVREGDVVKAGDTLGYVGSTGRSTAPHLHWMLYVNRVPVNPLEWVKLRACR